MVDHLKSNIGHEPSMETVERVRKYILNHMALPSMRALMTAGPALERNNIAGYNCAYVIIDDPVAFDETLFILMNGTGVGFSAESRYTEQLPVVPYLHPSTQVVHVEDSKEGWAYAFREVVAALYEGRKVQWDISQVRPAGARLMTFGGRASGPAPLVELFEYAQELFTNAQGRKLKPIEVHDLVCKIASVVVVGGVRRSALISLGDLEDDDMRTAKSGEWWNDNSQRALANNSAVYEGRPSPEVFAREWQALIDSGSGERGLFNRKASQLQAKKNGRRAIGYEFGTNPCSEIILRPNQFCNLSTTVIRGTETFEELVDKVEVATILGTWQSTLTNFQYLRPIWRENTEDERLLGVSMTGPLGHPLLNGTDMDRTENVLAELKQVAIETNRKIAFELGINQSAAVTCVKPEGTSSQLTLTASGLHTWHNHQYIRTVRNDKKDPMTNFMMDAGFPWETDVMNDASAVFSFPIKAPEGAVTRHDLGAIKHLEIWMAYQRYWCEHKPSVTIYVKPEEWQEVGMWVYENFNEVSGVSFLPLSEHTYQQAPYQDITPEEYDEWMEKMPKNVPWHLLSAYETEDTTTGTQELACVAGSCEAVDNVKV